MTIILNHDRKAPTLRHSDVRQNHDLFANRRVRVMTMSRTMKLLFPTVAQRTFHEGEGGTPGGGAAVPPTSPPPPPVSPPPTPPAGGTKTFTQEDVNRAVADERRKVQTANQKTIDELTALRDSANVTAQQKEQLQQQIETLTAQFQTKEQQQQTELGKLQKKYDTDTEGLKKTSAEWQQRYELFAIDVAITNAAVEFEAFSPEQIKAVLAPMTKMKPKLDEGGKPTNEFEPRVKFMGRDKDQKEVELDLSPREAVKAMTEIPEKFGNLFKNKAIGGLGGNNTNTQQGGNGRLPDIGAMTPQEYLKRRGEVRAKLAEVK